MPGVKTYLNLITLPHLYSIGQTSGTTLVYPPYGEKNYQRLLIVIVCINNIMWTTTWSLIIPENTVKMTTCHKIIDYLKLLFITGNIDGIKI